MVTLVMSLESMIIQGLDPEGDYITSAKGEPIFVIADIYAKEKYKEK